MRVLVGSDSMGALSSAQAGAVIAGGWPRAAVQVCPVGEAGAGFVAAAAEQFGLTLTTEFVGDVVVSSAADGSVGLVRAERMVPASGEPPSTSPSIAYDVSSVALGAAVARLGAARRPRVIYIDLTGLDAHDGGAGLLAGLGVRADVPLDRGVAGLEGLGTVDLTPAREALAGSALIGVVPADQLAAPLLGLRGITSLARAGEPDPARLLATDAALERLAQLVDPGHAQTPGAGACGGLGLAVLALGGQLSTGPAVNLDAADFDGLDLVVTGTSVFDFAARGGGVVAAMAAAGAGALAPCIVVAGTVLIGAREMRTMGVDAAYAVHEGPTEVDAEALASTVHRIARSWSW